MALTNAQCKAGKTNAGGSVSDWAIFTGEGYCKVVNKTISGIDFRLYGRAHSYSSANDTISITMYLFARKSSSTVDSYNNDKYSKIEFSCGGKTVDFTASAKGIRVEGSSGSVRCLGYKEVADIPLTTGSKTFKAIWHGIDGTDYASGTYTISETMYWNKNNASDVTPSITISDKTTTTLTAKVSNLRTDRNCYTTWVWNRQNTTTGAAWTDGAEYTVGYNSTTTTHSQNYSNMLAGNTYTIKFTCYLRNYNGLTETWTRKAPLWSVTKSVTMDKITGTLTISPTTLNIEYGKTGTITLTTNSDTTNYSYSCADTSIATSSRSGATITITAKKVGSTTFTIQGNASTAYSATPERSATINVTRSPSATPPSPVTGLIYTGSSQTGISGGSNYSEVSGNKTGINAGSYQYVVKPGSNYAWNDGTTSNKTISWSIGKATGFGTWTAANQSLKETQTYTAKVSSVHTNGVLKLRSNSDSSVASVSISGANATVTANKLGSTTIKLYVAGTDNYTDSADKSFTITVRPAEVKVGGTTAPVYIGSTPVRRIYVGSNIVMF